jgi:hypothetical protein
MRLQLISAVPGAVSLTSVGFHYSSNMAFVYSVFGLDVHLLTVAMSMLGIHVFIFLRELGRVRIDGWWTNATLNFIDVILQGLVMVPFFVTSKGGFIDLAEVDSAFWLHVLFVAAGIALLRFVVYLFLNCTFVDTQSTKTSDNMTVKDLQD